MASWGILGFGLGGNGMIFMKVALHGLSRQDAGAGIYDLFRDLAAPFGVAVFVPMSTNRITSLISRGASQPDAAVSTMHALAAAQLLCNAAGIAVVFFLPGVISKNSLLES